MKSTSLALLLSLAGLALPAFAADDISKVNGSIHAVAGSTYRDLQTVNGSISVEAGVKARHIETVNGSIRMGDNAQADNVETVNGGIKLGRNANLAGNVETVNGSIFSDHGGRIGGGVATVNGGIGLVGTVVGRNIETVNGDITVGVGSEVHGGVHVKKPSFNFSLTPMRKPRIIIGPNAVVHGELEFEREVVLYVHRSAKIGSVKGATVRPFDSESAPAN